MALHYDHGKWNKNRPIYLKLGLIAAILFVIILFQTEINSKQAEPINYITADVPDIITPPPTKQLKKKPPKPKPPKQHKIIEEIKEIVEFVEPETKTEPIEQFDDNDDMEELLNDPIPAPAPSTPEPSEPEPVDDEPVFMAERMPSFESCFDMEEEKERRKCTERHLLEFIRDKLKYPAYASENNVSGTVVASFVIDKSGELKDIEIIRDIGFGCGKAVVAVLEKLPPWVAGKQNGRPVSVMYRIPVKFESK